MRAVLFSFLISLLGCLEPINAVTVNRTLAPNVPPSEAGQKHLKPISLAEAQEGAKKDKGAKTEFKLTNDVQKDTAGGAGCANPSTRVEWSNMADGDRNGFINSVQCLMNNAPSGQWPDAHSRYEDIVALHQRVTTDVHGNAKFLVWHRYLMSTFENMMRTECGFNSPLPWFDEERWATQFADSPLFSNAWLGSISINGDCVTDGKFANHTLWIGPGSTNTEHCLSRNGNTALEADTDGSFVDACNARASYADMADCAERGPHNNGHNGVGGTMLDVFSSVGDPFFWLHHGFIDRNYRVWQNADPSRASTVGGTDAQGNPLTVNTVLTSLGLRPDLKVGDVLNTMGGALCYSYDY